MAVGSDHFPPMPALAGIRLGIARAGLRSGPGDDLAVIELAPDSVAAAVFTRNAFSAAPVIVAKRHLKVSPSPRWLLINAGNANAGTGQQGIEDALATCRALSDLTQGQPTQILPFSTGVIGEPLAVEKITAALPQALTNLSPRNWENTARAIMTTDTRPKGAVAKVTIGGKAVTIAGIAKGAGMIAPNMATMLAFIGTDAKAAPATLQSLLQTCVGDTFNAITVDGDTSTNDACILMATGQANNPALDASHSDLDAFRHALHEVCAQLAQAIVRDGEGATKLMRIKVTEAKNETEARQVAFTVANSPLVKTAFFAGDPNWGRILAAVGRAGIDQMVIDDIRIWLDEICIVSGGGRNPDYTETQGQQVMAQDEITVTIALGRGQTQAQVLTCDLSYDYVRINAEYRT